MKINLLSKQIPQNLDELQKILLSNRNLKTKKEIEEFLNPSPVEDLNYKDVGIKTTEMKKAIKLIKKYIDDNGKIIIYSDYDADGICAGSILWQALYCVGADAAPFIPSREEDGYGLSVSGIKKIIEQHPNRKILIITVDNGIVAHEGADYLYSVGVSHGKPLQLIITDHHVAGKKLPPADCILRTTSICGAGVAWFLAQEIFKNFPDIKKIPAYRDTIDLLTIATVADMVPLTKFNRQIVKFGFEKLKNTTRAGLQALFKEAVVAPENINTHTIGFIIAPRINAMGRLTHALDSFRLLCTRNIEKAKELANILGSTNRDRQNLTFEQTEIAAAWILDKYGSDVLPKALIAHNENYNQGVIGLIAGRLVEKFHRPAVVISVGETISKASARSINGFNIIEHLRSLEEYFINVGGHPMAAGFTIETTKINFFKEEFIKIADKVINEEQLTKQMTVECELTTNLLSLCAHPRAGGDPVLLLPTNLDSRLRGNEHTVREKNIISLLTRFSPFGIGNPEPIFLLRDAEVLSLRTVGAQNQHLKLFLKKDGVCLNAIGFGLAQKSAGLKLNQRVSVIFSLFENRFNGKKEMQAKVKEIV